MPLSSEQRERYARQLILPELGPLGQRRLTAARVTIVGAGGLGSTAALYLAAAGVGHLKLIDPDPLERSNLHRQILYRENNLDHSKVESAREQILQLNPEIEVKSHKERLTNLNSKEFFLNSHLIIDGSDNFATRWVIHHACAELGLPWIHGAAEALNGQLSVFWPNLDPGSTPCYACLYAPDADGDSGGCAQRGVLGMVPGIIAQLQAVEAIKLLTGFGTPLIGKLLCYDAANAHFTTRTLRSDPACECRVFSRSGLRLPLGL